jgi:hypothetical protein
MRKLFLSTVAIFTGLLFMNAQDVSENAIGLRLGDSDGFGAEISYQRALGEANRLEVDLGWRSARDYDGFKLTGIYQWVWELDGDFNWYTGAGGGLGSYGFDNSALDDETFVFVAGNVGIEYIFDIPLLLSLDFRPEFGFGDFNDDLDFDIALGIRYRF